MNKYHSTVEKLVGEDQKNEEVVLDPVQKKMLVEGNKGSKMEKAKQITQFYKKLKETISEDVERLEEEKVRKSKMQRKLDKLALQLQSPQRKKESTIWN